MASIISKVWLDYIMLQLFFSISELKHHTVTNQQSNETGCGESV